MLKARLDAENLEYEVLSIEEDEGMDLAKSLGVRHIPVLVKEVEGSVVGTLTGASYPTDKYKEFFS
jgi:CO dehydrogenase nickel-insertion accessory protein CooC1